MFESGPDVEQLAAIGLTLDDYDFQPVEIWPDHVYAFHVFQCMATQWRMGSNGPIGLDYGVLPEVWRRTKTPINERDHAFECLRVIERSALTAMSHK